MDLRLNRRSLEAGEPAHLDQHVVVEGTARLDRRTKRLVGRLNPGNVAVIDHDDLDRVAAESLLDRGVAVVVNARASISGRYPNLGPLLLARAGVPILDAVGPDVFVSVVEGDRVRLVGEELRIGDTVVARGTRLHERDIQEQMDAAHARLSETVERFAENTLDYVRREQALLFEELRLPDLRVDFRGRHALVVTRGHHYKEDLRALRRYIQEVRPVVVAVDGAADACLNDGITPDVIVGDMDSVSTRALKCGAELIVHPPGEWRRGNPGEDGSREPPPGTEQIRALGLEYQLITIPGMSEDAAMLLAHEKGAEVLVTVGSHTSLTEFLDKGRAGMASTFLARMRIGNLVDAKGVSQLYRTRVQARDLVILIAAAAVAMITVSSISPSARLFWGSVWELLAQGLFHLKNLL